MEKETLQERLNEVFEIAKHNKKSLEFLRDAIDHLFDVFLSSERQRLREEIEKKNTIPQKERREQLGDWGAGYNQARSDFLKLLEE